MSQGDGRVKLCFVIDNLSFRGGERVFAQQATGLDRARYDVTVACSPGGPFVEQLQAAGVRVAAFDMRPQFNPLALMQLTRFLSAERPAIVHCQGRGDPYGRVAATLAGAPIVISTAAAIVSRYWGSNPLRKLMYRLIDRVTDPMVDRWLVLNRLSVEVLERDHGIPRERIGIIPNGIEVERFAPGRTDPLRLRRELGLSADTPLIGALGRLTWEKGFDTLLAALPAVLSRRPGAHLVLAGDGPLMAALQAQAARLGVAERCHFLGFRADVPDVLAALDVAVLSSVIEGMPMALLEAMAAGIPTVTARVPGAVDLVDDGVNGLLVAPRDPAALAGGINRLLDDPDLAARLASAARAAVLRDYTVGRMVERTVALYERLLAEQGAAPTPRAAAAALAGERVKICYVIDNLSFRGGERVFAQLATGLDREHYDVSVACSPGGPFVEQLRAAGMRAVPINMRPQFNPWALVGLIRFLRRERPAIVHCQGRGDPYGRIAATVAGIPWVLSTTAMIHSRYWVKSPFRKLLYRLIDRVTDPMVDHWLVLNQHAVDVLCAKHGVPRARISIIPNGIEVERYAPERADGRKLRDELALPAGARLLGSIGRLTWQKGVDTLLRAMPAILAQQPGAHLALAGDGEEAGRLQAEARRLGVADRCHFLGFRTDIPDVLAALDLFVLSSLAEGMPMVLLEAMAAGVPVVATRIPGVVDLVEDGIDGLLVASGDPGALAGAIGRMLADRDYAAAVSRAAAAKVRRQFTVEQMVERTSSVYESVRGG